MQRQPELESWRRDYRTDRAAAPYLVEWGGRGNKCPDLVLVLPPGRSQLEVKGHRALLRQALRGQPTGHRAAGEEGKNGFRMRAHVKQMQKSQHTLVSTRSSR